MLRQTIEILTSFAKPQKVCVMGNVAIARGAIEAGVNGVFSYPGTPSTEISEVFNYVNSFQYKNENEIKYPAQTKHKIYFEYSINEKIALEKAVAFSIGNKSALCVMKNVGMNVASDALMSITYQTIVAPLVIVVCDDPGCHSSSNEQDSRYWGLMANVPVLNPANPAEALEMTKQAFKLSADIKLPVIIRTTTRVSHSRGVLYYGSIDNENRLSYFDRLPEHINIPARTAAAHSRLLEKLKLSPVQRLNAKYSQLLFNGDKGKFGIITSGVSAEYLSEIIHQQALGDKLAVLNLGMIHPFPEKEVLNFLKMKFSEILILEELDPIIENAVRVIAQKNKIKTQIVGKGFSELKSTGEFSIDGIQKIVKDFTKSAGRPNNLPLPDTQNFLGKLPPRPPTLCAGCPHRATFYLLKLAIPREESELILCGDIGCFGLGALPPLKMIDTINHMGMSISMAQGLFESFNHATQGYAKHSTSTAAPGIKKALPLGEEKGGVKKLVALLGDGTFFHSGLTSLVNAVYTRANILLVIFDNRTIGMTGHQSHPGASQHIPKYHEIDLPPLLKGLGIEVVETINPFDLKDGFSKLHKAMSHRGVSVVVAKSPCIFLHEFKAVSAPSEGKKKIVVDETLCNTCANHEDIALSCSRCYTPKNNLSRARAKLFAEVSIHGNEQQCPANICNHGFFNSILEGDYKSAVEIVRDKMLFSRTCGDICHRPCEFSSITLSAANGTPASSGRVGEGLVPIKALKKFVSSFDENFRDFSLPLARANNALKKNKKVAVVGAGPAGLSATYDLLQAGYEVEIFDKENKAGGMIVHAIPGFRMDKKGFDFEAMQLEKMGAKFHFRKTLGKDFTLKELSKKYEAVLLAIGLGKSKTLGIIEKNIPAESRMDGIAFLKKFNQYTIAANAKIRTILVIGGGNSAMDSARSARKLYPRSKVIVSCIESENTMPAFAEEVEQARNEGVEFIHDSYVSTCSGIGKLNFELHTYSNNKFLKSLRGDFVITAIGQVNDEIALNEFEKKVFDSQGRIVEEALAGFTNLFVAGDLSSGNNMSVIGAIASGKNAAINIRKLLENYPYEYEGKVALGKLNTQSVTSYSGIPQVLPLGEDLGGVQVLPSGEDLGGVNLYQSCMKCNHCIDNFGCPAMVKVDGKVKIEESRCTLCGLCIDVCPNNAIHWEVVSAEKAKKIL